ncbi:MAG: hypothetical protein LBI26_00125 [Holosporales bacterium]|jgi:hypothetical protein|nr:hypothetical protein [Holosporales bacterium]
MKKQYTLVVILLAMQFFTQSYATTELVIVPSDGETEKDFAEVDKELKKYNNPFQKFFPVGLFANDPQLKYSMPEDVIKSGEFEKYKTEKTLPAIEWLGLLSENFWIALNKRNLGYEKLISSEMENTLLGKYKLTEISLPKVTANKYYDLWFRSIEQIQLNKRFSKDFIEPTFAPVSTFEDLYLKNLKQCEVGYSLAKFITNTPLLSQMISYETVKDMDAGEISKEDSHDEEVLKDRQQRSEIRLSQDKLKTSYSLFEGTLSKICSKYADHDSLTGTLLEISKNRYKTYLKTVYNMLQTIDMSKYRIVDKGQTSEGNCNTCMFNSIFYLDVDGKNIRSTKNGSLEKASQYLGYLESLYQDGASYEEDIKKQLSEIMPPHVKRLMLGSRDEAMYTMEGTIWHDTIFPGNILQEISIAEASSMGMQLNFCIFFNSPIRSTEKELQKKIFSYYRGGCFASVQFPIIPVSCTLWHTRALVVSS